MSGAGAVREFLLPLRLSLIETGKSLDGLRKGKIAQVSAGQVRPSERGQAPEGQREDPPLSLRQGA